MYFVITDLSRINNMYRFSLAAFLRLFQRALQAKKVTFSNYSQCTALKFPSFHLQPTMESHSTNSKIEICTNEWGLTSAFPTEKFLQQISQFELLVKWVQIYLKIHVALHQWCSTGSPRAESRPPKYPIRPATVFQNQHKILMLGKKLIFIQPPKFLSRKVLAFGWMSNTLVVTVKSRRKQNN